ncbi:hypothetical protein RND71_009431 [Anisodus tanguticus]|uniref:Uncharacterized protein n=1 Tax=Anisodus tanguticus TaxID=243964 RepID=A0AAE1VMX1_9SOLA|nr:hypothetical protein RND71_009431 [Anisodus tanguticus]
MPSEKSLGVPSTSVIVLACPMTRSMFKDGCLEGSKCFISLEKLDKNEPTMSTARSEGNTSFSSSGEVSQACSNFYDSRDLEDSSTSNVVSAMMTNAANTEEQLAAMMQTIEALKKSLEDKDFQIAQLMHKLELCSRGESSHKPTPQEKEVESATKLPRCCDVNVPDVDYDVDF